MAVFLDLWPFLFPTRLCLARLVKLGMEVSIETSMSQVTQYVYKKSQTFLSFFHNSYMVKRGKGEPCHQHNGKHASIQNAAPQTMIILGLYYPGMYSYSKYFSISHRTYIFTYLVQTYLSTYYLAKSQTKTRL